MDEYPKPIACTLAPEQLPDRMSQWQRMAERVVTRTEIDGGVRVQFDPAVSPEAVAQLTEREHECCAFFEFSIRAEPTGVVLEVRAPDEARTLIDALLTLPA